jgi:hypothetical protein
MTQLTALERDLLACVERLVTASEASAKDLTALETRSTSKIERELAGLKDCVTLLIRSQAASMKALSGLLNDEAVNGGVKTYRWGGAKVGQFGACALELAALK